MASSTAEDHDSKLVAELKELIGTSEAMLRSSSSRSRRASRGASATPEGSSHSVNASVLSDHSYHSQSHNHSYSYHSAPPPAQSSFASYYSDARDRSFDSSFTTPAHPIATPPASNPRRDAPAFPHEATAVASTSSPINPDLASHKPLLQYMLDGSFVRNAEFQRLQAAWQQQHRQGHWRLEASDGSLGRESAVRDSSAKVIGRIRAAQEQLWQLEDKSFQDAIDKKFDEIFQPLTAPRTQQSRTSPYSLLSPSSSPSNSNKRPRPLSSPSRNARPSIYAPSASSSGLSGSGSRRLHVFTAGGSSSTSGSRGPPQSPPFNPISTPSSTPSHHYENMAFS